MRSNGFSKPTALQGAVIVALIVLAAAIADGIVEPYPLSDSHWDVAIYLLRARSYVEGAVIDSFRDGAAAIYDAVVRGVYPTPYWSFVRLGHTVLLGSVAGIVGTDEASIQALVWFYRALFAIGLFFAAMVPVALNQALVSRSSVSLLYLGAMITLALYLLCDVAFYLNGNLVSEVPAMTLSAISAWCLIRAWNTGAMLYAVVSGCAGFAVYAVRMESVWSYAALLVAMGLLLTRTVPNAAYGWKAVALSACTAGLLFLGYSWFFFPLTDPRLAIHFKDATASFAMATDASQATEGPALRNVQQLMAGNGLLWIGALLGLRSSRTDTAAQFGLAWFLVAFVPIATALINAPSTQTRMYSVLTPMLMILSTLGWASFLSTFASNRRRMIQTALLAGVCSLMLIVSQSATYNAVRELPGLWRLQYLRPFLGPLPFERINYHLPELVAMERAIAASEGTVLIASPGMQGADHIMVIQYLLGSESRTLERKEGTRSGAGPGGAQLPQVRLSRTPEEDALFLKSLPTQGRILLVGMSKEREWTQSLTCCGRIREISVTPHFTLWELVVAS